MILIQNAFIANKNLNHTNRTEPGLEYNSLKCWKDDSGRITWIDATLNGRQKM